MNNQPAWNQKPVKKTVLILAIVLVCLYGIIGAPASKGELLNNLRRNIHLGLDLRGGVSFVLRVRLQDAFNAEAANAAERLMTELRRSRVEYSSVQVTEARSPDDLQSVHVQIAGVPAAKTGPIETLAAAQFRSWTMTPLQAGSYVLKLSPAAQAALQRDVFEQTRRILERRINAYGLSESPIQSYGSRGNELLVQLPDVRDPAHIKRLLQSRTVLEWYSVEGGPYANPAEAMAQHGGLISPRAKLLPTASHGQTGGTAWYLLMVPPIIRGSDVRDARVAAGDLGHPVTTFTLSQDAALRFEQYTTANLGRRAAIVLDQQILSVPVIEDAIRDSGQIRGARNLEEAEDLALNLRSGSLPAGVEILQERTVEPSLGSDSIRHGMRAAAVGLTAVVAAMLLYYKRAGANATLALLLNGVLLIAVLAYMGAALTLPGIAGVVLTIGMAVDSNVLIFERIREELRGDKTVPAAVAAGFSRAFATLLDTHVTTVVSCAFLFLFGSPAVKGFAITLVVGLITNLFTSVFVSRVAFDWELCRRGATGTLSI